MRSLRPASNFIKNIKSTSGFLRLFHVRSEMAISCFDKRGMVSRFSYSEFDKCLPLNKFGHSSSIILRNSSMWKHTFSSQTVSKSSGEEDKLEDGFSELEVPVEVPPSNNAQMGNAKNVNVDDLISDAELSDVDEDSENLEMYSHDVSEAEKGLLYQNAFKSEFFRLVADHTTHPFDVVLNKWVEDGNELSKEMISATMFALRKCRKNEHALKLSWWLQKSKKVDFKERDYAIHVDLIAKLHGIQKAEKYIETIPKSFQGEIIYRTLLYNSAFFSNVKKSEEIFNKMKDDLKFPPSTFACNQLLSLYRLTDKKKIADVLLFMETQNLKPTVQTYRFLIDAKGRSANMTEMDHMYERMKSEGIKPDTETHFFLAKHYLRLGHKEKAEAVLKEMERDNIQNRQGIFKFFDIYASLSRPDGVKKLWKLCEKNPLHVEILAAMDAWRVLKNIEEAEAIFYGILKRWKKATPNQYFALLRVYADNKECEKGKNLVKKMADNGIEIDSRSWDILVKILLEGGEVEKAELAMERAVSQTKTIPNLSTYARIMSRYASRGDVHNCEKILLKCKQFGPKGGDLSHIFHLLVRAYVNSKTPAYGMMERMKADNVQVSGALEAQLKKIDAFRKTAVSDLFD